MFSFEKVTAVFGKLRNKNPIICTCFVADTVQPADNILIFMCSTYLYSTIKVEQFQYWPGQTRRIPGRQGPQISIYSAFEVVRFSALCTGLIYPQEIFLLEAESTPWPHFQQKKYVNEKFQ
jgi:hypothetical protein